MGVQEQIAKAYKAAHKMLGDVSQTVVYHATGTQTYNPATGEYSEAGGSDYTLNDVPVGFYNLREIDNTNVLRSDRRLFLLASAISFVPSTDDYVTLSDDTVWQIIDVTPDPSGSEYVVQVRR